MRETFVPSLGRTQLMTWPEDDSVPFQLRGVPKGLKQVLIERGLWPANNTRSDGFAFLTQCPTTGGRLGCNRSEPIPGGCCARSVMAKEPDFQSQKGQLEEELENKGQLVIFYPKFHCELNFIERYWCGCKWYARENCLYTFTGLRETVPKALDSVSPATIHRYYLHCMRIIDAYAAGVAYGTGEFKERVYKGHRQVVDKSKW